MPLDEILTLPINILADTDCHLYLCITNRSLRKGFPLLDAWGFRYITCLTWAKPSFGIGNYFRGQTEQILFGVKGSQPLKRKDVGTLFDARRGDRHSQKPEALFALIESCSPGPVETFQRQPRPGWTGWGEDSAPKGRGGIGGYDPLCHTKGIGGRERGAMTNTELQRAIERRACTAAARLGLSICRGCPSAFPLTVCWCITTSGRRAISAREDSARG